MKTIHLLRFILISFYFLFSCSDDNSVDPSEELELDHTDGLSNQYITDLNEIISPLSSCDPEGSLDDLSVLNSLGNAQIVGLGEATHGTKEFFQLKHKIFRYLVENHNFKIFAFECDMGESVYIDRYIIKGEGSLDEAMGKMHFWTWKTTEVAALISWMKEYNEGRAVSDKIHLIGDDCQFLTYQTELLQDFLTNISNNRDKLNGLIAYFGAIAANKRRDVISAKSSGEIIALNRLIDEAKGEFVRHKQSLISHYCEFDYKIHHRLLVNIKQTVKTITDDSYLFRDLYMSENAVWCSSLFNGSKVALWAHNGHVAKDNNFSFGSSQGYHINETIGNNYKVVGFSFSKGRFNAVTYQNGTYTGVNVQTITDSPLDGSINEIFYNAKMDNFIFDFTSLESNSHLFNFCNAQHSFLMIGSVFDNNPSNYYSELAISSNFDFIINYDFTSAVEPY